MLKARNTPVLVARKRYTICNECVLAEHNLAERLTWKRCRHSSNFCSLSSHTRSGRLVVISHDDAFWLTKGHI